MDYNEPWVETDYDYYGCIEGSSAEIGVDVAKPGYHHEELCIEWLPDHLERAVACVNALSGFPQERLLELQDGGVTKLVDSLLLKVDNLQRKVDSLTR